MAHVQHNSGNNEWYTPEWILERVHAVMGGIDLDPASSAVANHTVKATRYYTASDNGLSLPWYGRVWMNPPYSQPLITQFVQRLVTDADVTEWMTLTNNGTETAWGQMLLHHATAVCFINTRVRFVAPSGERGKTPLQGQMVAYCGPHVQTFTDVWRNKGTVLTHE